MTLMEREREVGRVADDVARWLRDSANGGPRLPAEIVARLGHLHRDLGADYRSASTLIDDLVAEVKQALMLPFSTVAVLLRRTAHDLAREEGKLVQCTVEGGDVEMDKRLLDALRDPLLHLVRNCVGHGIEPADKRREAGKSERGQVAIRADQAGGGYVLIHVSDDGAGIDIERLQAAARRQGEHAGGCRVHAEWG